MFHKRPINTALCSYGMSGRVFHAPLIEYDESFDLKYIVERTKELSKEGYPNATILRSFEEVLAIDEIDLVVINTPNTLHFSMAKQALEAGKHVVLEKPFTNTVKEGEALIKLAAENELTLTIYHNKRLEGDCSLIKQLVEENKLGEIKKFEARYDRYRPEIGPKKWKEGNYPGAGILYDLGAHIIDQSLDLFGQPKAIEADLQIQRKHGQVVDFFEVKLFYDALEVALSSSMLEKVKGPRIQIKGTKGCFKKYSDDPQESMLAKGWNPSTEGFGFENPEDRGFITLNGQENRIESHKGSFEVFYANLAEAILHQKPLLINPQEALDVIKIIELAYESSEKRCKIDL